MESDDNPEHLEAERERMRAEPELRRLQELSRRDARRAVRKHATQGHTAQHRNATHEQEHTPEGKQHDCA
jgi:hypothetical protein